jgi:hypothetical protein
MKPIVNRELGLTSADQTCDGRRYGVRSAAAAERFINDRREVFMEGPFRAERFVFARRAAAEPSCRPRANHVLPI